MPSLLRGIYVGRKTGMLRFIRGEERRSIRFMSGHIVHGEATVPELHLGAVLVAHGQLTPEALAKASAVVDTQKKRLGSVLVESGVLDHDGLEQALALHVRAILVSVFALREGVYTFQDQDPETFLDDDWPLALPTGQAILGAVEAVASPDDVQFAIGDVDRVLLASDDPLVVYQRIDLAAAHGFVLSRVDGTLSAREVLDLVPLPPAEKDRSLFALLCTGLVELGPERPRTAEQDSEARLREEILALYEGLQSRSPHDVLGVAREAPEAEVKAAYLRLAKRFHPDVHHAPRMADLRHKVQAIFFRLQEAYRSLATPRAPAVDTAASRQGEDATIEGMLGKADDHLKDGHHWEAIALLEEVIGRASGRLRTRARLLLGRALLKYPEREKQAERELQAVVQEDPDQADAHYLLGTLYKRRGLDARATAMLRRAVELNPRHRAALAEIEGMGPEPAPESRLRKLFKRG